jgi:outer membrane protein assembly factor BamE
MRMLHSLHSYSSRAPVMAAALSIIAATVLSGCASKNPLMDDSNSTPPAANTANATTPSLAKAPAGEATRDGVQTTKQRHFLGIFSPYRVDIQQGNFVSQEMVSQLKEGMTPEQVRFALGTPLLTDIFHADRWDYPFRLEKSNGEIISSHVAVFFKDNQLVRIEGGKDLPTEKDYLVLLAGAVAPVKDDEKPASPVPVPATAEPK